MKTTLLTTLLLLLCIFSNQTFSQSEYVVEIDKDNGSFQKITDPIGIIQFIFPYYRAYDENNSEYIFQSASPEQRLYSINTTTGSTVTDPFTNRIVAYQYDNTTNTLYGLDISNQQKQFVSINRTTGTITNIGSPISSPGYGFGSNSSFNESSHTYYFIDPSNKIYSINAANGNVIDNPNLAINQGEFLLHIAYDHTRNTLFGMLKDNNLQMFYLVAINSSTGSITKIGNGFTGSLGNGSATLDESNGEYIFMYSNPLTNNFEIGTIDVNTGLKISNQTLLDGSLGNLFSLKYDRVKQKLYSIHWEYETCRITSSITAIPSNNVFTGGDPKKLYLGYGPQSVTLNCLASGNHPLTYSWTGQDLDNYSSSSPVFTPTSAGVYEFTVSITEQLDCNDNDSLGPPLNDTLDFLINDTLGFPTNDTLGSPINDSIVPPNNDSSSSPNNNCMGCTVTEKITICVQDVRVYHKGKLKKNKVLICHIPPGNPANPQTLSMSKNAVSAHLSNHNGDALGECGIQCGSPTSRMKSSNFFEKEKATEMRVSLYPNPSNLGFNLKVFNSDDTPLQLEVYNLAGKLISKLDQLSDNPNEEITIGENWEAGIYFIKVNKGANEKMIKAVKLD